MLSVHLSVKKCIAPVKTFCAYFLDWTEPYYTRDMFSYLCDGGRIGICSCNCVCINSYYFYHFQQEQCLRGTGFPHLTVHCVANILACANKQDRLRKRDEGHLTFRGHWICHQEFASYHYVSIALHINLVF